MDYWSLDFLVSLSLPLPMYAKITWLTHQQQVGRRTLPSFRLARLDFRLVVWLCAMDDLDRLHSFRDGHQRLHHHPSKRHCCHHLHKLRLPGPMGWRWAPSFRAPFMTVLLKL